MDIQEYENWNGFKDVTSNKKELKDGNGRMKTQSLFEDVIRWKARLKYTPIYTMRDYEHKEMISAYLVYMTSADEYDAAMRLVGSMKHWRKLTALPWFMEGLPKKQVEGLNQWREDMRMRDASLAKGSLLSATKNGDAGSARSILNSQGGALNSKAVGRPKTSKDTSEADKEAAEANSRLSALARSIEAKESDES